MGDNQVASMSVVKCGACNIDNPAETKFCSGCGQNLYEPCASCGEAVHLGQRFCGACGVDLDKNRAEAIERYDNAMIDAVNAARDYEFDRAVGILRPVSSLNDYRFKESSENALAAIEKIEALRARAMQQVEEALAKANAELRAGNQLAVVQILESIPCKMLDEDAKKILARAKSYTSEVSGLAAGLQDAIQAKDWPLVGGLVDQLLSHAPEEQQYQQLARQVAVKLSAAAKQLFASGKYSEAVERLAAVPTVGRNESFQEMQRKFDNVEWLSKQFASEPFVTPMLGRMAVRLSKEVSDDSTARDQVKQLATKLKRADRSRRNPYPDWTGSKESWIGGEANVLGGPTSIEVGEQKPVRGSIGRFHVAFGLALQGLGHGRVSENFAPKKGLLKGIGWRKSKRVWGIDLGRSAIKAVCLEESDGGMIVVDSYFAELSEPTCRSGVDGTRVFEIQSQAIDAFVEGKDVGDIPVWVNVPASELVNRFVRLPPVSDKQANEMIKLEIEQRIPINVDDLSLVRWLGDHSELHGRAAVISATKKAAVEQRMGLFKDAGIEVTGIQADSLATVNFVCHEFAETLTCDDDKDSSDPDQATPTLAFFDCGASATSLILVSPETHWIWTIENGGEDLTAALSRRTKTTHSEAEALKRNPAELVDPAKNYAAVEQRQDELRARMEKVLEDARSQNHRFEVIESWCMGGGTLAHQWIRRLMLEKDL